MSVTRFRCLFRADDFGPASKPSSKLFHRHTKRSRPEPDGLQLAARDEIARAPLAYTDSSANLSRAQRLFVHLHLRAVRVT